MFNKSTLNVKNAPILDKRIAPKMCKYKRMSRCISKEIRSKLDTRSRSRSSWKSGLMPKRFSVHKSHSRIRKNLSKDFTLNASSDKKAASSSPYEDSMEVSSSAAKLYKRLVSANTSSSRSKKSTISTNASSSTLYSPNVHGKILRNLRISKKLQRNFSGKSSSKRSVLINLSAAKTHSDVNIQTEECSTPSSSSVYENEFQDYGYGLETSQEEVSAVMLPKIDIRGTRCLRPNLF